LSCGDLLCRNSNHRARHRSCTEKSKL